MTNKIYIGEHKTIEALQNEFNAIYPYLKIEFYKEPHVTGRGRSKNKLIRNDTRLSEVQKIKKHGSLKVTGKITVSDFELEFEKKFGLYIQVFRKSGNVWLETSATDNWTLNHQNEEGENLLLHFKTEKENHDGRPGF